MYQHTYLRPSYFSDTLILAISVSMKLGYTHFSNFTESYEILANTSIQCVCLIMTTMSSIKRIITSIMK